MSKNRKEVEEFIEALQDAGYEPKSYSGRGMYGKGCVAVSGNEVSEWDIARELFNETHRHEFENVPAPRQDQLGRGLVLYWPSYEWPEDRESAAEEDEDE